MLFRNLMASTAPMLWAPDDAGAPTQAEKNAEERKKIAVTGNGAEDADDDTNSNADNGDEKEDKADAEATEETNEEVAEAEDEEEAEADTVEAKAKEVEKLKKTIERLQRRVDKKTGSEGALRKELDTAKKALEAKKEAGEATLTEEDVTARAKKIADDEMTAREFTRACNKLLDDAVKIDKGFEKKIKALAEDIGEIPSQMIGILDDLDNGGAVLAYLADPNNADDAEKIWAMPMAKMTLKLVKIANDIESKAKKPKAVSKVPAPNEPVNGRAASAAFDPRNTKVSDKEWIEQRNKQVAERKAMQRAALR